MAEYTEDKIKKVWAGHGVIQAEIEKVRGEIAALGVDDIAADVTANKTAIATLTGEGAGSVTKAVADAIAGVVASAPEDFNTLKEVSDWIATHKEDASALQVDVADLKDTAVRTQIFDGTRKTIQLANHDTISGIGTNCLEGQPNGYVGGEDLTGKGFNLVMLSKWNIADFGSNKIALNLNAKDGKVTINDSKVVATQDWVNGELSSLTDGAVKEVTNKVTTLESVVGNAETGLVKEVAEVKSNVSTLTTEIGVDQGDGTFSGLKGVIATQAALIEALTTRVEALEAAHG